MPSLNYLVIERPFYVTSTGNISKEKSFFVYSSSKVQFSHRTFLEGIYRNMTDVEETFSSNFSFVRSNYMVNERLIDEAVEFIEDYLDDYPSHSVEVALIEANNELDLSYEEVEILEKKISKIF